MHKVLFLPFSETLWHMPWEMESLVSSD
jgi:hypothetical protein